MPEGILYLSIDRLFDLKSLRLAGCELLPPFNDFQYRNNSMNAVVLLWKGQNLILQYIKNLFNLVNDWLIDFSILLKARNDELIHQLITLVNYELIRR